MDFSRGAGGTVPLPRETRHSRGVSGHSSLASCTAMAAGLLAVAAPSWNLAYHRSDVTVLAKKAGHHWQIVDASKKNMVGAQSNPSRRPQRLRASAGMHARARVDFCRCTQTCTSMYSRPFPSLHPQSTYPPRPLTMLGPSATIRTNTPPTSSLLSHAYLHNYLPIQIFSLSQSHMSPPFPYLWPPHLKSSR